MGYDSDAAGKSLRDLIGREVRALTPPAPVTRQTQQAPVTAPVPIQRTTTGPTWLLVYDPATELTPPASTPAWVEHKTGFAAQAITVDATLEFVATTTDAIFDAVALAGLDNAKVQSAEWLFKAGVTTACGVNQGQCFSIADGRFLWAVWLRAGGLNIDGQANVPAVLDDAFHRFRLDIIGTTCTLFMDGVEMQSGGPAGPSAKKFVVAGTWVSEVGIV